MIRFSRVLALCAALLAAPAAAQIAPAQPQGAVHWRALAQMDLEAAYVLVRDNHPAAVAEVGDDAFRAALDKAIGDGRARAAKVDSYAGYAATLNAFAVALGDKHIWSRQAVRPATYNWTGLMIARRGGGWWVAEDAREGANPSLAGAKLIGCDGIGADEMGAERLGLYRAVWSVEAQRVQNAPWLLVDDGNPFLTRPAACEFEASGKRSTVTLDWSLIGPVTLSPHVRKAINVGSAGFGVRRFAGGYWIALESLDDRARAIVDAVKAQATDLRAAPMVVLDLRGNGGGASSYGVELARALMGDAYLQRVQSSDGSDDCSASWRATPDNLEGLRAFKRNAGANLDPQTRQFIDDAEQSVMAAIAAGKAFDTPVRVCRGIDGPEPAPANGRGSLLTGRMIVLTDADCFSSCLLVVQQFRRLGAVQVGDATDAATRYMEVREALLPSGISYASTLQKVSMASPRQIGPFVPAHTYEGDIADTEKLEAWVAGLR